MSEGFISKERTYSLPPSLGLALSSSRGELVRLTITEVRGGKWELTPDFVCEILALVANLIHDADLDKRKLFELQEQLDELQEMLDTVRGAARQADHAAKNMWNVMNDRPVEDEDES